MSSLNRNAALLAVALTAAFTAAGWIWGAAVLSTRLDLVQTAVVSIAIDVKTQGQAVARIEGRLDAPPSRLGALP